MNLINKSILTTLLSSSVLFSLGCGGEEEVVEAPKTIKTVVKKPKPKTTEGAMRLELRNQSKPKISGV